MPLRGNRPRRLAAATPHNRERLHRSGIDVIYRDNVRGSYHGRPLKSKGKSTLDENAS